MPSGSPDREKQQRNEGQRRRDLGLKRPRKIDPAVLGSTGANRRECQRHHDFRREETADRQGKESESPLASTHPGDDRENQREAQKNSSDSQVDQETVHRVDLVFPVSTSLANRFVRL